MSRTRGDVTISGMSRLRVSLFALSVFLVGFVIGVSRSSAIRAPNATTACNADADCVAVTRLPTCSPCGNCPRAPFAVARSYLSRLEAQARACPRNPSGRPLNCAPCASVPSTNGATEVTCRAHVCTMRAATQPRR